MTDRPTKSAHSVAPTGRVALVGAGPGDPGLITVAGLERLRCAEVVVHDALANPRLLDEAPPDAERIDVGKRAGAHKLGQERINALLVDLARQGRFVVRLKGGDPYLFGRGGEEAVHLAEHAVPFEVVPGITAGIAAPMTAGIPVTHRQLASTVTFVTGHEDPAKDATAIDYRALAALVVAGGTVCFYMGVARLRGIAEALIARGLDAQTPAAAVQWGTTPRQRVAHGTIESLPGVLEREDIGAPAIVVVGPVAALPEQVSGLDFFAQRPLFGQTVLVTRTRQQASELARQLEALGAEVIETPTIELVPPESWDEVDAALGEVGRNDWLVLTSANGVRAVAERFEALGLDARHLAGVRLAAIGDATARALHDALGVRADLVPQRFVAESLADELIAQGDVRGRRFLLLRADIARPALPERLSEAGAVVNEVVAYRTKLAEALPAAALEALEAGRVNWVTFTSSSTARNLVALLGERRELLAGVRCASIGPITSETMRELGLTVALEAERSNVAGLVAALTQAPGGAAE